MGIDRFFVRTMTITEPAPAVGYGTTPDYDNGTSRTVTGWFHQLTESELHTATRGATQTTAVIRLAADDPITSNARVTIDGTTYDVTGPPARPWTPTGEHHVRVPLGSLDG